ncbi:N-acetylmuramoyl-L-alanine amidase [Fusobacterium polymorphum]|uniref:N-acetylmuramoyl-L-alanine amidase n=1 Tax=Fusobacterium nucleatum subsp. polymorphum TaxID=76857 RepID=UPI00300AD6DA
MKKFAIVIGHNPRGKGAYSKYLDLSEYEYWRNVCDGINKIDDSIDIYSRKPEQNYIQEMKPVVAEINKHNYELALELHFNAASPQANGCECLVYFKNEQATKYAELFMKKLKVEYGSNIRKEWNKLKEKKIDKNSKEVIIEKTVETEGIILITDSKTRGGYGICNTNCTYVLVEPFFGTNEEANKFKDVKKMANFIVDFINSIKK